MSGKVFRRHGCTFFHTEKGNTVVHRREEAQAYVGLVEKLVLVVGKHLDADTDFAAIQDAYKVDTRDWLSETGTYDREFQYTTTMQCWLPNQHRTPVAVRETHRLGPHADADYVLPSNTIDNPDAEAAFLARIAELEGCVAGWDEFKARFSCFGSAK